MMGRVLRTALAQINSTVGGINGNVDKINNFVVQAQKNEADIVAFPELAICGYPPEDLLLKGHFVDDNLRALHAFVKKVSDIVVVVGFVDIDEKKNLYNAAGIIHNGRLRGVYRKIELPNYGVFDEKRYFHPGKRASVFELGGMKFAVNICEDIWRDRGVAKLQADKGAEVIINISASPYHIAKVKLRQDMLKEQAKDTGTYICYNNLVGGQDELVFDGGSMIVGPNAEIIIFGKQFEEDLVIVDLPIKVKSKSKLRDKKNIRLGELKRIDKPALSKRRYNKLSKINEIYSALVLGTRDYIRKNGFEKVVLGLSGGMDSSLTAVIACDAIESKNVVGISMPSRYSSQETQADAKALANNLGVKFIVSPIESIFSVYLAVLDKEFVGLDRDVTEENLQARIRGNILMAFSNKYGWLVLTTGNKSETSVGYCTLYGDMAGGFAVIKDVPKTFVYKLARFRNERESKELIPQSIFTRDPSAELRDNQRDEDLLPPYSVLDPILKAYVEEDKSFEEMIDKRFNFEVVKNVIQMVDRNEYKRRQSPPGIKITPKAFGKDRRLPITNGYNPAFYSFAASLRSKKGQGK